MTGRGLLVVDCLARQAVEEFSAAIKIDDTCMEAWKRRGQSRAAMGQDAEAVLDLTRAAELAPKDADIYHQRGLIYFKLVPRSRPPPPPPGALVKSPTFLPSTAQLRPGG